jgi:hypothetical protein
MNKDKVFYRIDRLIDRINEFKIDPGFSEQIKIRQEKKVPPSLNNNEIIKIFTHLIAYSQNANSKLVEKIIDAEIFDQVFKNYDISEIIKLNPCDLADEYWDRIGGIRQQAKLFHIVSLARKINRIGSFSKIMTETEIPKQINEISDIDRFWLGFKKLKEIMIMNKIPFFRSTTSLLHFLLHSGYDCVKPDLVVMKVAKKIGVVEKATGENNLISTVRTIQEYAISRKIRPAIVDYYFLIDEGQMGIKRFVKPEFYEIVQQKASTKPRIY